MSEQHIPSLSSIVDQTLIRYEHVAQHGNPDEARALKAMLDIASAFAHREERLLNAIESIQQRVKDDVA